MSNTGVENGRPLWSDPRCPLTADRPTRGRRQIDLTGAATANLSFATSYDVEGNYDFFVVEAHTVGQDDWTTLNDLNGHTPDVSLAVCTDGLWSVHPFIFDHYIDQGTCASPGPTGEFHGFNGSSDGWVDASFDLSAFAGSEVEISLTYISDVGAINTGAFVDDVVIDVDGVQEFQGWETDQAPWVTQPPPAGSPGSLTDWQRSTGLVSTVISSAVATEDTIYLPFGFEAISTAAERTEVMGRLMGYLLD